MKKILSILSLLAMSVMPLSALAVAGPSDVPSPAPAPAPEKVPEKMAHKVSEAAVMVTPVIDPVVVADTVEPPSGEKPVRLMPYRLGPEDVLSISVWKEDGLEKETMVRPDGMLNFPLVGAINVLGRTIEAVHDELVARIERYIPEPVVSVSLLRIGSNRVFVIGEVNKPGAYLAGQYLDVMQALTMAGGFTPYADRDDIRILRRVAGKETVIDFDYDDVAKGKQLKQNIVLQNGDVLVIP